MKPREEWHRWSGAWWSRKDWDSMPAADRRIAAALGDDPLPDLRHLVPPLEWHEPAQRLPARTSAGYGTVPAELIVAAPSTWTSRAVWRCACSLGMRWGHLDLFHWHAANSDQIWFSLHRLEEPAGFLPERVSEGDRVRGVVFVHDPDLSPDPAGSWQRMVMAAAAWTSQIGGNPIDRYANPIALHALLP